MLIAKPVVLYGGLSCIEMRRLTSRFSPTLGRLRKRCKESGGAFPETVARWAFGGESPKCTARGLFSHFAPNSLHEFAGLSHGGVWDLQCDDQPSDGYKRD
jgi:hypothetical protein